MTRKATYRITPLQAGLSSGVIATAATVIYLNNYKLKILALATDNSTKPSSHRTPKQLEAYADSFKPFMRITNDTHVLAVNALDDSPFSYAVDRIFLSGKFQQIVFIPPTQAQQEFIHNIKKHPSALFESYGIPGKRSKISFLESYGLPTSWRPFGKENAEELLSNGVKFILAHEAGHLHEHHPDLKLASCATITGANTALTIASALHCYQARSPMSAAILLAVTAASWKNYTTYVKDDAILAKPPIPKPIVTKGILQRAAQSKLSLWCEGRADSYAINFISQNHERSEARKIMLASRCMMHACDNELEKSLRFPSHPSLTERAQRLSVAADNLSDPARKNT